MRILKGIFFALSIAVALVIILAIATSLLINSRDFKTTLENQLHETIGLDFKINGDLSLHLLPSIVVYAGQVSIGVEDQRLVNIRRTGLEIRLADLLDDNLIFERIWLENPVVMLDKARSNTFMQWAESETNDKKPFSTVLIKSLELKNGRFIYQHEDGDVALDEINLETGAMRPVLEYQSTYSDLQSFYGPLTFVGSIANGDATFEHLTLEKIRANIEKNDDVIRLDPLSFNYFGESARIIGEIKVKDKSLSLRLRGAMSDFNLGRFIDRTEIEGMFDGKLRVQGAFVTGGRSINELLRNIEGGLLITANDLKINSFDVNKVFDEFNKMKRVDTSDIISLLTLGPLFSMFNHAYNQLNIISNINETKGESKVSGVVSEWDVANGHIVAKDVAFVTQKHRIAVQGAVDFLNQDYVKLKLATIDQEGCIINSETIDGPFTEPNFENTGFVNRTIVLPLKRLTSSNCGLFYTGSLPHPAIFEETNEVITK